MRASALPTSTISACLLFAAEGAPHFKEIALFTVPEDAHFDAAEPWRLQLMIQRVLSVNDKAFATADLNYQLPQAYTVDAPEGTPVPLEAAAPAAIDAAAGVVEEADSALRKQIWQGKRWQIGVVSLSLLILVAVFFFQDTLTKHPKFYDRFRLVFLTFSLFYIGWYAQAQLSVVNVLTFTTALRTGFSWEYFLMDPLVFILWCATAIFDFVLEPRRILRLALPVWRFAGIAQPHRQKAGCAPD